MCYALPQPHAQPYAKLRQPTDATGTLECRAPTVLQVLPINICVSPSPLPTTSQQGEGPAVQTSKRRRNPCTRLSHRRNQVNHSSAKAITQRRSAHRPLAERTLGRPPGRQLWGPKSTNTDRSRAEIDQVRSNSGKMWPTSAKISSRGQHVGNF